MEAIYSIFMFDSQSQKQININSSSKPPLQSTLPHLKSKFDGTRNLCYLSKYLTIKKGPHIFLICPCVFLCQLRYSESEYWLGQQYILCRIIGIYQYSSPIYIVLFDQSRNMLNQTNDYPNQITGFRKITPQSAPPQRTQFNMQDVTRQIFNVINSQTELIMRLLARQAELSSKLERSPPNSGSSSGSQNKASSGPTKVSGYRELTQQEQNSSGSQLHKDPYMTKNKVKIISNLYSKTSNSQKNKSEPDSNSNDASQNSEAKELKPSFKKRQTQTKNMVKNFSKSIFSFIRKHKEKRQRVLSYLTIDDEDFMKVFELLRGRIHSIRELRHLWTPQGNIYHKAFRILSCEYLRKYCLQRTFNSRVENYTVHLKYRKRLLDSLKSPEQFTILKTN